MNKILKFRIQPTYIFPIKAKCFFVFYLAIRLEFRNFAGGNEKTKV